MKPTVTVPLHPAEVEWQASAPPGHIVTHGGVSSPTAAEQSVASASTRAATALATDPVPTKRST